MSTESNASKQYVKESMSCSRENSTTKLLICIVESHSFAFCHGKFSFFYSNSKSMVQQLLRLARIIVHAMHVIYIFVDIHRLNKREKEKRFVFFE